jgi:hypothetical protein
MWRAIYCFCVVRPAPDAGGLISNAGGVIFAPREAA